MLENGDPDSFLALVIDDEFLCVDLMDGFVAFHQVQTWLSLLGVKAGLEDVQDGLQEVVQVFLRPRVGRLVGILFLIFSLAAPMSSPSAALMIASWSCFFTFLCPLPLRTVWGSKRFNSTVNRDF
jgi:hypothetical protein